MAPQVAYAVEYSWHAFAGFKRLPAIDHRLPAIDQIHQSVGAGELDCIPTGIQGALDVLQAVVGKEDSFGGLTGQLGADPVDFRFGFHRSDLVG